jgi:DNA repair protein RAD50
MYGEKEVKAEVKLAFQSVAGNSMVCTRTMQVIAKKTGNTFKSLEGQLLQMNRGERTTISTKCAELESLVPRNLGTPRPILDYVIFCHQEDSLWPLSEPANLKKRFDEIFEALKFTKALDNLKTIKKEMAVEIKLLDQSVKHLKQDKERADRTRDRLLKSQGIIQLFEDETAMLESEIAEVTEESDLLFKSNQEFQEVISRLDSLKNDQRSTNEQLSRLQDSCQLLPDSDEVLNYKLANFQDLINKSTGQVNQLKSDSKVIQSSLIDLRKEQNVLMRNEGELKAKEKELNEKMAIRDRLLQQFSSNTVMNLLEREYREFESQFCRDSETKRDNLESLRSKASQDESVISQKINENKQSQFKETQHKQYATTDINNLETEIKTIQSRISSLELSEGNLEYEKSALEDLEQKLKAFNERKFIEKSAQEIKSNNNQIATLENEIEEISRDISKAHKQLDAHAKISLMNDELKFKDRAIQKLLQTNQDLLDAHEISLDNPLDSYNRKLQKFKIAHVEQDRKLKQLERQQNDSKSAHTYKIENLEQLMNSVSSATDHFQQQLGDEVVDEYDEIVLNAEEDYKIALENLKMATTTLQFNKKALEVAQTTDCCYLCSRKFDNRPVLESFVDQLKRKTDSGFDSELQAQLTDAKQYLDKVRSVASDVEKIVSTKDRLDDLQDAIEQEIKSLEEADGLLNEQRRVTEKLSEDISNLEALRNPINEINRLQDDISGIKRQLDIRTQELTNYGLAAKSLEDLQKTHSELTDSLKNLRKDIILLQEEKDSRQREFAILEGGVKDKRLIISDMERSLIERENLLRSINDNRKKITGLEETVAKSAIILEQLAAEQEKLETDLSNLHQSNQHQIQIKQREFDESCYIYSKFQELNKSATEYFENVHGQLNALQQRLDDTAAQILQHEINLKKISDTISTEELRLADSNNEERNLRANLDIRHLQDRLSALEQEAKELEIQNAEAQRTKYQERSNRLRQKYTHLTAELAGKRGEIRQIEDQVKQLQKELDTDFKDVEKNYREEWTKLQTRTVVSDDLTTYSKALDNAIMSFHSLKMKEINRIIDELWKTTYSGTDVDTIKIKSDPSTGKGNRSYNYRVVMYKQDAELDMRGRCSAGQKVLACIIIRLALSECFGTNCGVIALDEPTTNLDRDNIESLAHSLGRIIEMRRSQKNFQLIVITHDENFLHSMGAGKYTDHFFQLRRDDSQNSRIELVDIAKVSI